jgi:putative PIN family toxin of toxin-antitoxin system
LRVVIDTNVLVSALWSPGRTSWRVVEAVQAQHLLPLYDGRILAEYREVLSRPRFRFPAEQVGEVLASLEVVGERVAAAPLTFTLPDQDDAPFLEVALSGRAHALVTGNARDFAGAPAGLVVSPQEVLERLAESAR